MTCLNQKGYPGRARYSSGSYLRYARVPALLF
jgi:hypothetical protein